MRRSVQILIARKAADATALTAREAIQTLLGYGADLAELHRRQLVELEVEATAAAPLVATLESYLERTVTFWNPNRERAWVRLGGADGFSWEGGHGTTACACGAPALDDPGFDHLLIWSREDDGIAPDLGQALGEASRLRSRQAEVYSFRWRGEPDEAARTRLLKGVAVAESRGRGLLVQPHYQDHRFVLGPVPIPVWGARVDALH
ncbi:MAG: hypothetical protein R3E12_10310 [Candidatus Eisenbacteria bacterium]